MVTVACVLKRGPIFTREWVWALKRGLARHASNIEFAVLTDDSSVEPPWRHPLVHHWPKWWSKLELFRPGALSGPTIYFDLDTLIVGSIAPLVALAEARHPLIMLSDFNWPTLAQSGVMVFNAGTPICGAIWRAFTKDPRGNMRRHRGDGEFIHSLVRGRVPRLQDLLPGQIVSLKKHALHGPPEGARVVCGHGIPRLSSPSAGWAHAQWKR